jgi:hypothetical protein
MSPQANLSLISDPHNRPFSYARAKLPKNPKTKNVKQSSDFNFWCPGLRGIMHLFGVSMTTKKIAPTLRRMAHALNFFDFE